MDVVELTRSLSRSVSRLKFGPPVTHVYNPLSYARKAHECYLERFARRGVKAVLLGMNPGPYGMAQTGVPFGEVESVREWIGIHEPVGKPRHEHPKRPVLGFDCTRSEVSGRRIWHWARDRFTTPERFFERFFVWNYCPLSFMEESGRNRTPDKLPAEEREPLYRICDRSLIQMIDAIDPEWVIGVGKFAEKRAREILGEDRVKIGSILHPSPASPIANRGWAEQAERQFEELGIPL